jgi:hypothetical protein
VAEDHLLRLVVELGGDEFPSPIPPPAAAPLREPDHAGAVALRAELFTGVGGRGARSSRRAARRRSSGNPQVWRSSPATWVDGWV